MLHALGGGGINMVKRHAHITIYKSQYTKNLGNVIKNLLFLAKEIGNYNAIDFDD